MSRPPAPLLMSRTARTHLAVPSRAPTAAVDVACVRAVPFEDQYRASVPPGLRRSKYENWLESVALLSMISSSAAGVQSVGAIIALRSRSPVTLFATLSGVDA